MPVSGTNGEIITYLAAQPKSPFYQAYSQQDINNIENVYADLLGNFNPKRNQFVQALYMMIGWDSVSNTIFKNPYNFLKKAPMRYGKYEREIFVNMLPAYDYNFYDMEKELMQIYESNVMAAYHELRFKKKWAVTISYDELRDAFAEPYGLQSLINSKLAVIAASVEYWEYETINTLIGRGYANRVMYPVTVTTPTDQATAQALLKQIKAYTTKAGFPNPAYNFAGAQSPSRPEDLILITTPDVNASLDVDALAVLFNAARAEVRNRIVVVDKFMFSDIVAVLIDMRWFKWREQLNEMGGFHNPDALRTNFFYHYRALISASPFYTAIAFTTLQVSLSGITLPTSLTYVPGEQVNIDVKVTGTANRYIPQGVTMQITSAVSSPETVIVPGTTTLLVGSDETATSITVTATSTYDNTKSASLTLTSANAASETVSLEKQ